LDPLNGLKVAGLLRAKLAELRPSKKDYFDARYDDFRARLGAAMVGETLAKKYEFEKLALLAEHGKLVEFLKSQGDAELLGGWLGAIAPHHGTTYADEHDLWPYFARRFGLRVVGHMEPLPGVPPTTKQLALLVERMRAERVPLILSVTYYDAKHARFLAAKTGAAVAALAHQVGALPGADDYLSMFDANVKAVVAALGAGRRG
jgi:ABC-type Zn uptake system ZnuABC Zn-binding protein ZnuA